MSTEIATGCRDPRTALVEDKYFEPLPELLRRWLWQSGLNQTEERVYWVHWQLGRRSGDWCSTVTLAWVAAECGVSTSTVSRAYQTLRERGLIRREEGRRHPADPHRQLPSVTEVRLPREVLVEMGRAPNRPRATASTPPAGATRSAAPAEPRPAPETPAHAARTPLGRRETERLFARMTAVETQRYNRASREYRTHMDFDPAGKLTGEERAAVLALLANIAGARPEPTAAAAVTRHERGRAGQARRLGALEVARLGRSLATLRPQASIPELLREVIWAAEEGALAVLAPAFAVNVALKKIREGAWTRPHRMPPNWRLELARPELCAVA
jgi:hypothetical protein